jgi:hypothetical protein
MGSSPIVSDEHFLEIVEYAVGKIDRPVTLGCMRPRGNPDLEFKCFEAGISGIAIPSKETVRHLEQSGIKVEKKEVCCSFHDHR